MQDDIRAQLIKQFPSEVIEAVDTAGREYYACPTCRRAVAQGQDKCNACKQVLSWSNIRKEIIETVGIKKGYIEFELPADFSLGDCRKCPLSYIGRSGDENVYECPMNWRGSCKMKIK